MRVAIFGGTFDPIHKAHLTVAREAMTQFGLSSILFVVAANPPHKAGHICADYEDRYRMVELACKGEMGFVPSRLEEEHEKSYSIYTVEKVRALVGAEGTVYFLIGADAFSEIQSWYRWPDVVKAVHFIVVTRPGHKYTVPPGAIVHRLDTLALPISSSEIRAKLARGEKAEELPEQVFEYVRSRGLYGYPSGK
jgi:nicotinate-nucleotide adenylyltransferase